MTLGYVKMLRELGVNVDPPRMWPIEWIDFRIHPCPYWPGVRMYQQCIREGSEIDPVVICRQCFTISDGWHRVAAYWLEGCRSFPVQLADRHLAGAKECCKMANVDHVDAIRPFADLGCVSGSYHAKDWAIPAFAQLGAPLTDPQGCPTMRMWERIRSVCFLGNVHHKRILDVGTRESLVPIWLSRRGAKVDILEMDTTQVHQDDRIRVFQGDVKYMPKAFRDATYDMVLCTAVLKSLSGWGDRRAVKEMVRVLRPGGLLAISVDYGQEYLSFPSEATGVRLYDRASLYSRIITPSKCTLQGPVDFDRCDWTDWPIRHQSPRTFKLGVNVQVAFILLKKVG